MTKTPAPLAKDVVDAFLKHATAQHGAGNFDDAARLYEHVEAHNPDVLAATYFRAMMDVEVGRLESALARLRRVVAANPRSIEGLYSLGYTYQELGLWPQAAEQYRRILALEPQRTGVQFMLVTALEILGKLDEAAALLRDMTQAARTRLQALGRLAQLRPAEISAEEKAQMQAAAGDAAAPVSLRLALDFALGELLERQGEHDAAFAAFAAGNALRRQNLNETLDDAPRPVIIAPPSARPRRLQPQIAADEHAAQIAFAKKTFTRDFLAAHAGQGADSRAPIFIVGMPRSGSTLIEQILSSHPKVTGLGECAALWAAVGGHFPYTDEAAAPDHFRARAEDYLARLRALGWRKTPFAADKMLGNYMSIGMIHLMFPNAVILHAVRDPVDNCLACFRKLFKSGNETTYDLGEIGAQYVRYREMMAHWDAVLPGRVIDVDHEALVAAPEAQIRWLITDACRLKWDEDCLRFHQTTRAVRTASTAQVRQPIFKTSVARWRRYERHLGPLLAALGPYAPAS